MGWEKINEKLVSQVSMRSEIQMEKKVKREKSQFFGIILFRTIRLEFYASIFHCPKSVKLPTAQIEGCWVLCFVSRLLPLISVKIYLHSCQSTKLQKNISNSLSNISNESMEFRLSHPKFQLCVEEDKECWFFQPLSICPPIKWTKRVLRIGRNVFLKPVLSLQRKQYKIHQNRNHLSNILLSNQILWMQIDSHLRYYT